MTVSDASAPDPAAGLRRRSLLAAVGTGTSLAVATALAGRRPDPAWAALLLGETTAGVDSVAEAQATAAANAWGGQSNGKIPAALLARVPASVGGSGFLRDDAARQFFGLSLAFRAAQGRDLVITEGYRSYERQLDYWNRYQAGKGNLAAYPGTSNHGWGISCDFGSGVESAGSAAKRWMDANAPGYGWSPTGNSFSQREPWHFDFTRPYPGPQSTAPGEAGLLVVRVPGQLTGVGTSYTCVVGLRYLSHFRTLASVHAVRALGVPYHEISPDHFLSLLDALSVPRSAVVTGASYWRR